MPPTLSERLQAMVTAVRDTAKDVEGVEQIATMQAAYDLQEAADLARAAGR